MQEGGLPIHCLGRVQLKVTPSIHSAQGPDQILITWSQVLSALHFLDCGINSWPLTLNNSQVVSIPYFEALLGCCRPPQRFGGSFLAQISETPRNQASSSPQLEDAPRFSVIVSLPLSSDITQDFLMAQGGDTIHISSYFLESSGAHMRLILPKPFIFTSGVFLHFS